MAENIDVLHGGRINVSEGAAEEDCDEDGEKQNVGNRRRAEDDIPEGNRCDNGRQRGAGYPAKFSCGDTVDEVGGEGADKHDDSESRARQPAAP